MYNTCTGLVPKLSFAFNMNATELISSLFLSDHDGSWQLKVDVFTEVRLEREVPALGQMAVELEGTSVASSKDVTLHNTQSKSSFDIAIPEARIQSSAV